MTTMAHADARFVPHPDAVLRRVGNGAILVQLDRSEVFELNDTAARAWELTVAGHSRSQIVATLCGEFDGEPRAIAADVDELVSRLIAKGLLTKS